MERERAGLQEKQVDTPPPVQAPKKPRPQVNLATSVDLLFDGGGGGQAQNSTFFGRDAFGAIGGGVLTREGIADAQKVTERAQTRAAAL